MKNSRVAEETDYSVGSFFDPLEFGAMTVGETTALTNDAPQEAEALLDTFVTVVKWVFLYLPGATTIHLIMIGFALLYFYKDWSPKIIVGSAGILAFAMFMVMIGIGKLKELKYLRVVGAIVATSALMSILYSILITIISGDFFRTFIWSTLPFSVAVGFLVKRLTDRESE